MVKEIQKRKVEVMFEEEDLLKEEPQDLNFKEEKMTKDHVTTLVWTIERYFGRSERI